VNSEIPAPLPASLLEDSGEGYDVVVVGFGIAGACAALEAARAGARVLLLERASVHGGTTSMSGGHFYLGGGTAVQRATGHEDSPEEMYKYLVAVSKEPEHDKIRAYCEGSVEHFGWLESLGFRFERSFFPGKAVIQPGTEGLMFTGNEKVWPFCDIAKPAPRGHKVPVPGDTGGTRLVMDLLRDRIAEAGVEVRYETGAAGLIIAESGAVVGLAWRSFDDTGVVRAATTVIAAGGFVMNPEMVAAYTPALGAKLFTLGTTYDDGLGIRLGASAGADLKHMDEPFITAPFYPPPVLVTGLIVNSAGERFVAEDSYHARTSAFVMEQAESAAYLIVDSRPDRWIRPWPATTSMPPAVKTRTSASARSGWRRRTRARGRSSICGSATRSTPDSPSAGCAPPWTRRCSVRTARLSLACTRPGPAPAISRRTARATAQEPSSARARSSAAGPASTRPPPPTANRPQSHNTTCAAARVAVSCAGGASVRRSPGASANVTATDMAAITVIAIAGVVCCAIAPAMAAPMPCMASIPEPCKPNACPLSESGVSSISRSCSSRVAQ
jgi:hypothetical protein